MATEMDFLRRSMRKTRLVGLGIVYVIRKNIQSIEICWIRFRRDSESGLAMLVGWMAHV